MYGSDVYGQVQPGLSLVYCPSCFCYYLTCCDKAEHNGREQYVDLAGSAGRAGYRLAKPGRPTPRTA
jgi:hypothetical protein